MRHLEGKDYEKAMGFIRQSGEIAKSSGCERARCGSVIVKDDEVIGLGFNSPPAEMKGQKRCSSDKKELHRKVTDKTCCVHAEPRAIMDSLKRNPDKLEGSTLYFVRLSGDDLSFSGKPYCTVCSKMALDSGVKYFVLYHEDGIGVYDTEEYNILSYQYSD